MSIEVPVLSQESEWSWYFYRSACIKPGKWVVMIFFIEVPVLSQESEVMIIFIEMSGKWVVIYEYRSACIKPGKWVVMIFCFIEVPVLSQESEWSWYYRSACIEVSGLYYRSAIKKSEWSWYEYRSACIKPGKWVVMIWV